MKKNLFILIILLAVFSIVFYNFMGQDNLQESEAATASFWSLSPTARLMARTISAEARGEPFVGQVAVGAVIMNRVRSSRFPNTISGVIYQPWAFTAVAYGHIWNHTPSSTSVRAAISALNGWDPTYGSIYYYNPAGVSTYWIYSRQVVRRIGKHIFAR
ncbi:MAG: cell wall hydrolase [Bacillota bacterium]